MKVNADYEKYITSYEPYKNYMDYPVLSELVIVNLGGNVDGEQVFDLINDDDANPGSRKYARDENPFNVMREADEFLCKRMMTIRKDIEE